ncbi:MAG: M23 family metallopeptidase [Spirochaetaceae bacterium]
MIEQTRRTAARLAAGVVFALAGIASAYGNYPIIEDLNRQDVLFAQLQDDIARFHQARRRGDELPPLFLFRYRLNAEDSFFRLSSRTTLPQSTLATVNRFRSSQLPDGVEEIIIPNQPGIFVPLEPETDLEFMLSARLAPSDVVDQTPPLDENDPFVPPQGPERNRNGQDGVPAFGTYQIITLNQPEESVRFAFFPGGDFTPDERRAFLGVLFRGPVEFTRVSSPFGARIHPFTALPNYHTGVDFAAPEGSPVRAAREGTVIDTGWDPVYGYYVILEHDEIFSSFYGHLAVIHSELNDVLTSGTVLGEVGNTGLSTGPHLHFEIRVRGSARDPLQFLPELR